MNGRPLRIALTPGEPAGIGPDICIGAVQTPSPVELVAIADPDLLQERAQQLRLPLTLTGHDRSAGPAPRPPGTLSVLPVERAADTRCGHPDPANVPYVLQTLRRAVQGCMDGEFDAVVTGPVHKGVINAAGVPFSGHTELLAELTGAPRVVMMLVTEGLRVALVTTHLPLREIFGEITPQRVEATLRITHDALRDRFGIGAPRLLVCGLNPHAGEDGYLGDEETIAITPVIRRLAREGMHVEGPLPADTAFIPARLAAADAVVAMYHDQGLPVLKHKGFGEAVNVTLGLPIVRTSVDHGTALELAGTGRARWDSLLAALRTAARMAGHEPASQ